MIQTRDDTLPEEEIRVEGRSSTVIFVQRFQIFPHVVEQCLAGLSLMAVSSWIIVLQSKSVGEQVPENNDLQAFLS